MSRGAQFFLIVLRISIGWYFLYQGITSILDSSWSLLPYVEDARTFPDFYGYIADSAIIASLSYVVKGLFVVIGATLIPGIFVRISALLGALLVLFFYFPLLQFPYVGTTYYIVDEHLILVCALIYLCAARAGEYFGLGSLFRFSRY